MYIRVVIGKFHLLRFLLIFHSQSWIKSSWRWTITIRVNFLSKGFNLNCRHRKKLICLFLMQINPVSTITLSINCFFFWWSQCLYILRSLSLLIRANQYCRPILVSFIWLMVAFSRILPSLASLFSDVTLKRLLISILTDLNWGKLFLRLLRAALIKWILCFISLSLLPLLFYSSLSSLLLLD